MGAPGDQVRESLELSPQAQLALEALSGQMNSSNTSGESSTTVAQSATSQDPEQGDENLTPSSDNPLKRPFPFDQHIHNLPRPSPYPSACRLPGLPPRPLHHLEKVDYSDRDQQQDRRDLPHISQLPSPQHDTPHLALLPDFARPRLSPLVRNCGNCGDEEEEEAGPLAQGCSLRKLEGVYRCAAADKGDEDEECGWEVCHGTCSGCGSRWSIGEGMRAVDKLLDAENVSLLDLPSRDLPNPDSPPISSPPSSTINEEDHLLSLGCPSSMITRYRLAYSPSDGIIATADSSLKKLFDVYPAQVVRRRLADRSGVVEVLEKKPWEIHLGRRVEVDEVNDKDGMLFMRALLDGVLEEQVKLGAEREKRWVTVEVEYEVEPEDGENMGSSEGGGEEEERRVEKRVTCWVTRKIEEGEQFFSNGPAEDVNQCDTADPFIDDGGLNLDFNPSPSRPPSTCSVPSSPVPKARQSLTLIPAHPLAPAAISPRLSPSSPFPAFIDPDFDTGLDPDVDAVDLDCDYPLKSDSGVAVHELEEEDGMGYEEWENVVEATVSGFVHSIMTDSGSQSHSEFELSDDSASRPASRNAGESRNRTTSRQPYKRISQRILGPESSPEPAESATKGRGPVSVIPESDNEEEDQLDGEQEPATFDQEDGVFRCKVCFWEVSHGECQQCWKKYKISAEMQKLDDKTNAEELLFQLDSEDRDYPSPSSSPVPSDSTDFSSLGAPPAMVIRYRLTYSFCHGLVATADGPLRTLFGIHPTQTLIFPAADGSGDVAVLATRPWKIHLGKRVKLQEGDEDGSRFMQEFVEEILEQQMGGLGRSHMLDTWLTVVDELERETMMVDDSGDEAGKVGDDNDGRKKEVWVEWVTRKVQQDEDFETEEDMEEVMLEIERSISIVNDEIEEEVPMGEVGEAPREDVEEQAILTADEQDGVEMDDDSEALGKPTVGDELQPEDGDIPSSASTTVEQDDHLAPPSSTSGPHHRTPTSDEKHSLSTLLANLVPSSAHSDGCGGQEVALEKRDGD
ncbi:hypothetical protein JCM11641_004432 [Rhodosporidiobolus odoratus]